jgi:hypothetical protein
MNDVLFFNLIVENDYYVPLFKNNLCQKKQTTDKDDDGSALTHSHFSTCFKQGEDYCIKITNIYLI